MLTWIPHLEPALAGRGLERALKRIASESGSLKSRSSSPLRSHTPSEADIPHSAVDLQNKSQSHLAQAPLTRLATLS
jgi:hypothetical protein